ncbi:Phosphatidylethanolamine N-methyltransferase [Ophiocordyceps camponoti-floridani]|uniref:Phosphatidylethanolamine N-methyltransferase n=1 Tax=Ophiocordyceps camponoti-floridani TaxID=2030778 RepID=A0A8H4VFT8_9HYPO|nr:Phosphatidylethanolamine N-methyltransferase [Ophiocordyceps camponoti-floridani]
MEAGNWVSIPGEVQFYKVDCALCGAVLSKDRVEQWLPIDRVDDFEDFFKDRQEETAWLNKVRLLSNDPKSNKPLNIWLSKTASDFGQGNFIIDGCIDPVKAYYRKEGEPFMIPFHNDCYGLLELYMLRVHDIIIDHEVLYDSLCSLSHESNHTRRWGSLDMHYYGSTRSGQGYGEVPPFQSGSEYRAMSPGPNGIAELLEYMSNPPLLENRPTVRPVEEDSFALLSDEEQDALVESLTGFELSELRLTSPTAARLDYPNDFWRDLYELELPWVLEDILVDVDGDDVDWETVYNDLNKASNIYHPAQIHGLANRRRIWEWQFPIIAAAYSLIAKTKNSSMRELASCGVDLQVEQSLCLKFPPPLKTAVFMPTFIDNDLFDLSDTEHMMRIFWTFSGELAGIDIIKDGRSEFEEFHFHGDFLNPHEQIMGCLPDMVTIPSNDWVTGLVMYTHTYSLGTDVDPNEGIEIDELDDDNRDEWLAIDEGRTISYYSFARRVVGLEIQFAHNDPKLCGIRGGEARLVHTPSDRFVVGFRFERQTSTACVTRLALVTMPIASYMPGIGRVQPDRHWRNHEIIMNCNSWALNPPPYNLRVCRGVGWILAATKTLPYQALVLGTSVRELANLKSISIDKEFRGIRADFHSGLPKTIGWMSAQENTCHIDGPGGEVIISVFVTYDAAHGKWRLEIITNKNKFLMGSVVEDGLEATRMPTWTTPGGMHYIGGFYGCWLKEKREMAGFGLLTLDARYH